MNIIRKSLVVFTAGLFMMSSAFSAPVSLTVAAEEYITKEEYIASLAYKDVTIDYNVNVVPDEYGVIPMDNLMHWIDFDIFTAEEISLGEDETIPANKMLVHGELQPIQNNENGNIKKVCFDDKESISLPKGRYYIKQTGNSHIVTVSEKRTYFTVGEDIHNEREYIDLTQDVQTVTPRTSRLSVIAVDDKNNPISDVKLRISLTDKRSGLVTVIYKGVSDVFGDYENLPKLALGSYDLTFASDNYTFDLQGTAEFNSNHEEMRVDVENVNGSIPLYIKAVGKKIDSTAITDNKVAELEEEIAKLKEENAKLVNEIKAYESQTFGDIDGDGNVTSADALEILRHSVGLSSCFDNEKGIPLVS